MTHKQIPFSDPCVAAVFDSYPTNVKSKLMALRQMIFDVAAQTDGVGELHETLKWGQPSYLTNATKSGTTIRIDQVKSVKGQYAMYVHCQTTLIDTFKEIYGDKFRYEGNRGMLFHEKYELPKDELSHCIAMALTYHLNKK